MPNESPSDGSTRLSSRELSDSKANRPHLAQRLRWLLILRAIFFACATLLVLLVVLSSGASIPSTISLLKLSGVGFLLSLFYFGLFSFARIPLVAQAYLQFLGDLLLISALVFLTGGATSLFSMLYLVVIATAATTLRRRAGITIAEIAWLLYATSVVAAYQGWFSTNEPLGGPGQASVGRLAYGLAIHLVGFYSIAVLTSLLSNRVARAEHQLAVATGDLEMLEIFHRDVVESMSSGLALVDLKDNVLNINRTGRNILNLEETLEGAPLSSLGFLDNNHWQTLKAEAGSERIRDEVTLKGKVGETRFVGFSVGQIHDTDKQVRGHSIVFQDLTEWRHLQDELSVKERMAAVGELAAGLAHEIGNPLAAISGSVQLLRSTGSTDPSEAKLLDIVLKESQRLDRTIKGFLRFAKPNERADQRFDICDLTRENINLLRNSEEVLASHQLLIDLEPEHLNLIADRDQIVQVFWNLARNSLRAMPNGGVLEVAGRIKEIDSKRFYRLVFKDTGEGMTEEQKHGLFHPFRSNKGGTGIGMAIVYRIVEAHQGEIQVESTVGSGTAIRIDLPL